MGYVWRVAVVCVAIVGAGSIYERLAERGDRMRLPQIGQSVSIGTRSLNIFCAGHGTPAVIFDAGGGMPGFSWVAVQRDVSTFTHACWYDRAGYGWSDPARATHTSTDAVNDLHSLLSAAHVAAPYVLVGHSLGGLNVRVYTGLFRQEVAGMVLVDASHEDIDERLPGGRPRVRLPPQVRPAFEAWMAFAAATGLLRISSGGALADVRQPATITARDWATIQQLAALPKTIQASATEWFRPSAEQARVAGHLGDVPLIVLTAGQPMRPLPEGGHDHRAWLELQAELARLSTRGRQVIVAGSGHLMPFDSPEAIVAATREVVADVREERGEHLR